MIRSPAVAGQFYPSSPEALRQQVSRLLELPATEPVPALGVISPHAGYIYSGRVAGETLGQVVVPPRVIILGPNHHGAGMPLAVSGAEAWSTPLGDVRLDQALREAMLKSIPDLVVDDLAHRFEHSLEVQVPFLQLLQGDLRILPVCVGPLALERLLAIGQALGRLLANFGEPVLMVASSDMTHYEAAGVARRKDLGALDKVLALDAEGLYRKVRSERISMCGVLPSVIMLAAACEMGASSARLVRYAHSGEVTGDDREVVGYAGVVIH